MDFVSGLPKTKQGFNVIWVIVDRLTKTTHFIPGKSTYRVDRWAQLYIKEIVRLHGVPMSIVSDRDTRFTSQFWRSVQKALGTQLRFSTTFHPQTDGQTERLNQVLENMLRACSLDFFGCWDEHLPLMEFAYNNSYQATIQMAPFEALYGRRCRTPVFWEEVGTQQLLDQSWFRSPTQRCRKSSRGYSPHRADRKAMQMCVEGTSNLRWVTMCS